ncbi:MAG: NirD/YgiW/YdeI family stress tolerance protein [Treponema sp.]|nr:NirD/YgiW/YdeI family stress tolerance protein [Treponema sp.]
MNTRALLGFFLLSCFFAAAPLQGQAVYHGQPISAAEARVLPHDSWVTLVGTIVNALPGGRNYTFRDSSGEMVAEIDWNIWRGLNVGASETVEICGEIKINRGQVSVQVRAIARASTGGANLATRRPIPVAEAIRLPNDTWVTLSGYIVTALPGVDNYGFRDLQQGEIVITIEQRVWRGLFVGENDRVEISGELRQNRGVASLTVRAIRKL